jgi:diacylglycerol kinase (ATP)
VAEELSDMAAASFNPVVRIIKDMASGAVLVGAFFAVGVGICLFGDPAGFCRMPGFFEKNPVMLILLLFSIPLSVAFIVGGPIGMRDYFARKKNGN